MSCTKTDGGAGLKLRSPGSKFRAAFGTQHCLSSGIQEVPSASGCGFIFGGRRTLYDILQIGS